MSGELTLHFPALGLSSRVGFPRGVRPEYRVFGTCQHSRWGTRSQRAGWEVSRPKPPASGRWVCPVSRPRAASFRRSLTLRLGPWRRRRLSITDRPTSDSTCPVLLMCSGLCRQVHARSGCDRPWRRAPAMSCAHAAQPHRPHRGQDWPTQPPQHTPSSATLSGPRTPCAGAWGQSAATVRAAASALILPPFSVRYVL